MSTWRTITEDAPMGKMLNPAHPGERLRESVRAMGWTVSEAARGISG